MKLNFYLTTSSFIAAKNKKAKKVIGLIAVFLVFACQYSFATNPITVSGSNGKDGTYATLTTNSSTGAFFAINSVSESGKTITITITGNVTEPTSGNAALTGAGGTWTSLLIEPNGGAFTISASVAGPLITLSGASCTKVTIDGLNTGGNSLTISNTSTSTSANTIKILNAPSNTIQNCTILGSSTLSNQATIYINTATGSTQGCTLDTIRNNTIAAAGTNYPFVAIYSAGLSTTYYNTLTISNNNIQDYYNPAGSSYGVSLGNYNGTSTISHNNFFQSGTRTSTAAATPNAIYLSVSAGPAVTYTARGNIIGYGTSTLTGTTTYAGNFGNTFCGIYSSLLLSVGSTAQIDSNIIAGINITSTATASAPGVFSGINIQEGAANIGTNAGNIIGTSSAPIVVVAAAASNSPDITGIYVIPYGAIAISNNIIQNISATGLNAANGFTFNGIWVISQSGSCSISNNNIGDGLANSIVIGTNKTTTATLTVYGIQYASNVAATITDNHIDTIYAYSNGASQGTVTMAGILNSGTAAVSITNNVITSLTNISASATTTYLEGIYITGNVTGNNKITVTGNTIAYLTDSTAAITTTPVALSGIDAYMQGGVTNIINASNNIIHDLYNKYNTTAATQISGIYLGGSGTAVNAGSAKNNMIYSLGAANANTSALISGIQLPATAVYDTLSNNIIQLGDSAGVSITGSMTIYGIQAGTNNIIQYYFNSVYISGSGVGTSPSHNTYALYDPSTSVAAAHAAIDNIFVNARSSASAAGGYHTAIYIPNACPMTLSDNDYYANGTEGVMAYYGTNSETSISAFHSADANQDNASLNVDPGFTAPSNSPPDLTFAGTNAPCALQVNTVAPGGITVDYNNLVRANYNPVCWGALAWTYCAAPAVPAITSTYCTGNTTVTGTCSAPDATVINVYKAGSTLIGTTTVSSGTWTATVSPALTAGDVITAKSGTSCQSVASSGVTVQSITASPSVTTSPICDGTTTVSGTSESGAAITVLQNSSSVGTTTASGTNWTATVTALTAGTTITATATASGKCVSSPSGGVTVESLTGTPSITTSPICDGATTVSGTSESGASITVLQNGSSVGTTTASGTNWTATVTTLTAGSTITATATTSGKCTGLGSSGVTVESVTATPAITTSPICDGSTTVSGTSESGAAITVLQNGSSVGTTTASGTSWIATVTALTAGESITATALISGKCVSAASGGVAVESISATPTVTTSPITVTTASISGTSSEADGTMITLYIDGTGQPTVTVSGGNWTVSGLSLTAGQSITVTATVPGKCVSAASSPIIVQSSGATPTITVSGTLSSVNTTYGTPSATTSFTVSGANMATSITVSAPSGFEVSTASDFSSNSGTSITVGAAGTIDDTTIYVRLAGTTAVGTYSGNVTCSSSGATTQTVATDPSNIVSAATLTVTADNKMVTYGDAVPTYTAMITGYINSDNSSVVSGSASFSCSYTSSTPVSSSTLTITPSIGTLAATNYVFSFATGLLTINPKALMITTTGPTKIYGTALTAGSSATNFTTNGNTVAGETVASVTLTPDANGLSATTSAGTSYTVTPSAAVITGGNASAANYTITYNAYSGTVGTYTLTISGITANSKTYDGTTAATLNGTATLSATVNSDVITLGGSPTATFASANVANGITVTVTGYTISGTNVADYTLTQPTLSANIYQASQTITYNSLATQTYGNADFRPGATASSGLTVSYSSSNTAVTTIVSGNIHIVAVGTCNIIASQAGNGNYSAALNDTQLLTVNQKALTITANNVAKVVGTTLTGGSGSTAFTSNGLVSPETVGSVTITYGTGAASGAATGTYIGSVTPSAATGGTFTASNYSITYVAGNIIVTPPVKYWKSATAGGAWTTGSNWSTVSVGGATCNCTPANGDSVVFGNTSAIAISSVPAGSNGSITLEGLSTGSGGLTLNSSFGSLTVANFTMNDGSVTLGTLYMEVTNNLTLAGAGGLTMGTTYNIVLDNIVNINSSGSITLNGPANTSSTLTGTLNIAGSGNFNTGSNLWVLELNNLNLSGTGNVVWQNPGGANSIVIVNGAITESGSGMIDFSFGSTSTNYVEFLGSSCTNSSSNFTIKTRQWKTEVIFSGVGNPSVPFISPVFYGSAPANEPSSILIQNNSYVSLNSSGFPLSKNAANGGGTSVSQTLEVDFGSTLDCGTAVIQGPVGSVSCPACPSETINGTIKTAFSTGLFSFSGTFQGVTIQASLGSGSTVEYNASGAQDLSNDLSYIANSNIVLSGSGAKTISTAASGTLTNNVLSIKGSATASVTNNNVSVYRLFLGNVARAAGTYGSTSSTASNKNNTYFTSGVSGYVNVQSPGVNAAFSGISSVAICAGVPNDTLTGVVSGAGPSYPLSEEPITVTINGVTQYTTISNSTGAFSIIFTGLGSLAPGIYTVTYNYSGFALNPVTDSSTSISIGVGPSASVLSGTATICVGGSANLAVAITGGKSPYTVVINNGGGTTSNYTSGSNISVSPSSTTTYSLTSVTDACGLTSGGLSGTPTITVQSITAAPSITSSPICDGTITVSGTSESNATVTTFQNGSSVGSTTASGTNWTATVTALTAGSSVTAKATASGKCVSPASGGVTVQSITSTPAITSSPICEGATTVSGTSESGAAITVLQNGSSVGTTTASGTNWTATVTPLTAGASVTATADASGKCASASSAGVTVENATTPPSITTSPVCPEATTISGTSEAGAAITVLQNGSSVGTTTASGTNWTASVSVLTAGVSITATAIVSGKCVSAASSPVTVSNCFVTLTVKLFIQGYYLGSGSMSPLLHLLGAASATAVDTVTIELHDAGNAHDSLFAYRGVLNSDGNIACSFSEDATGNYYIVIKHRNSIDTWSASAQPVSTIGAYDFTGSTSQAYGNNMVGLGDGSYGIYSGDISNGTTAGVKDGHINSSDYKELQSALPSFTIGVYDVHDLNGDGMVDEDDYRLMKNNASLSITVSHP